MTSPRGNTGPFPPWPWKVEPWPWHDVDGVRYCDEHGVYQCRFCESAYLLKENERLSGSLKMASEDVDRLFDEVLVEKGLVAVWKVDNERLRAAVKLLVHAYETDNRPARWVLDEFGSKPKPVRP